MYNLAAISECHCVPCSAAACIFLTEPEKMREKDRREVLRPQTVSIQHADGDSGVYTTYSQPGSKEPTERDHLIQKTPVPLYGLEDSLDVQRRRVQDPTCCMPCVTCCTNCQEACTLHSARSLVVRKSKAGAAKVKDTLTILQDRRVFICTVLYGMIAFIGALSNQVGHYWYTQVHSEPNIKTLSLCMYPLSCYYMLSLDHSQARLGPGNKATTCSNSMK